MNIKNPNQKFWATTFTLSGTIIGAGILGLPRVFAQSGLLIGLLWLILIGTIMIFVNLCLGEVTLKTKGNHQLPGYAETYLGKRGKNIMFFAMIFGIYSALLAYLVGEGESLSRVLHGNISPLLLGIVFWLVMTFLSLEGLKGLKKVETWGLVAIITIVFGIFFRYVPQVNPTNLTAIDSTHVFTPIGVIIFALLGFSSIPELRREIKGSEKLFKKAIIYGSIIPIILYIMFSVIFIGVLGANINEVATLSFGPITTILGIFTLLTSFFVLSFSLKDVYQYDLNLSPGKTFFFASIVPLLLYIAVSIFELANFTQILSIGGVVSGGLTGILILLISIKAKRVKKEAPINMKVNWKIFFLITLLFIVGIILEFSHILAKT